MRNVGIFSYSKNDYTKFFYTINKKNYLFRLTFVNADGISVDFQKGAVKELFINDNVYSPFLKSYVVIENTDDVIERYVSDPSLKEFTNASVERGYRTRGDARDLVLMTIIPIEGGMNPYNEQGRDYCRAFGFQYVFCIINEEDVFTANGKRKKYDLMDFDEEILTEKKIFFSSTQLLKTPDAAFLTDNQREVFTGDILKSILQTGLEEKNVVFSTLSGNNYVTPYFESGASKLFYSSPNNNTALDDLEYIYNLHVSNSPGKDFSFLQKDHFTGEYVLESVSSIFSKSYNKKSDSGGLYFLENLSIAGTQDSSNVMENDIKKPLRALEFGETGDVINIKFFNTPGRTYQEEIRSILVHSYNFEDKLFSINCVDGDIEKVKQDFSELYVDVMKGKDNRPTPNFILNNTQKTNKNFDNVFLPFEEHGEALKLSLGRNRILKNALRLNLGVEIITQGGLHRQAGKFISVDRKGSYIDNDFDNKFLGIYFIINVEHMFINDNEYVNKIIAVKTYHFTDLKIKENIS